MPNPEFHFTLNQMFVWIVSVCGGITGIAAAIAVMVKFNTFLKKPNHDQDVKIKDLTTRVVKLECRVEGLEDDFKKMTAGFYKKGKAIIVIYHLEKGRVLKKN